MVKETKPILAGNEYRECAGQPMVDVYLPMLEPDENSMNPSQTFDYKFNGEKYSFERGRWAKIPRDHYLALKPGQPRL